MTPFRNRIREVRSAVAGADLSNMDGRFVKLDASGNLVLCNTAGERADGVLLKGRAQGQVVNYITLLGGGNIQMSTAAVPRNSEVATDVNGLGRVARNGEFVLGIAREAAAVVGGGATVGEKAAVDLVLYHKNP